MDGIMWMEDGGSGGGKSPQPALRLRELELEILHCINENSQFLFTANDKVRCGLQMFEKKPSPEIRAELLAAVNRLQEANAIINLAEPACAAIAYENEAFFSGKTLQEIQEYEHFFGEIRQVLLEKSVFLIKSQLGILLWWKFVGRDREREAKTKKMLRLAEKTFVTQKNALFTLALDST